MDHVESRLALTRSAADAPVPASKPARGVTLAWATLGYTLFVILFGAIVRITGSGAGCGQHWPTCQGEIEYLPQRIDAVIEYTHRLTSGLLLLIVIAWVIGAVRGFEKGHMARRAAGWTLIFTITESLVGAALVLLALVGENDSVARAYVMAAHLVNTSLLTAAITLMAWSWREHAFPRLKFDRRAIWPMLSLLSVLVISASGAVTALGDTLYPVHAAGSVSERIANDHALGAHFLQRLRALHPMFAFVLSAGLVAYAAQQLHDDRRPVRRCAAVLAGLVLFQLALGVSNVWLSAPGWLQVIHLAAATSVWVVLVLLTAYSLEQRAGTVIGMAEGQAMSAPPA